MKVEFFLMVIMRQQNPLERHTANAWESLPSMEALPQVISACDAEKNLSYNSVGRGMQAANQGDVTLWRVLVNHLHRIQAECGVWASWKERSLL